MLQPLTCRRSLIVGRQRGVKINFYPADQLPQPFHKGGIHRPQSTPCVEVMGPNCAFVMFNLYLCAQFDRHQKFRHHSRSLPQQS